MALVVLKIVGAAATGRVERFLNGVVEKEWRLDTTVVAARNDLDGQLLSAQKALFSD